MGWRCVLMVGAVTVACGETTRNGSENLGEQGTTNGQGASSNQAATGTQGTGVGGAGGEPSGDCSGVIGVQLALFIGNQADAEAMRNVGKLEGSLLISGSVTDLSPLACLSEVTGDVTVYETVALEDLSGLEHLATLGGALYIGHRCDHPVWACWGNPALQNIDALRNLKQASAVIIEAKCFGEGEDENCARNAVLTKVRFDELRNVDSVILHENPALTEVHFGALAYAGSVSIQNNDLLESLQGFESLSAIDESLGISGNPKLPTCEAEWLRDHIGIENIGAVGIEGNDDSGICE